MPEFIQKFMHKLGRRRVILDRDTDEIYMIRYYLFLKDRKRFPLNLTLHKIYKSDDPILHSHPWSYGTLILSGGYNETLPIYDENNNVVGSETYWRGPGYFTRRPADAIHYLTLKDNIPCTTLFVMGPQKSSWGFLLNTGWVNWKDYIKHR